MKITFLGTGTSQGIPVIGCGCDVCRSDDQRDHRLRTSILIETEGRRMVIDCGPDFRQQMLRENIHAIDAILITHGHKDHIGGLDDVRAFNYVLQRPMELYAAREVQMTIHQEFSYAFDLKNRYPGVPEINIHLFENLPFEVNGIHVIPIKATHYQGHYVFGFRINNFSYLTDAVEITETEKEKMRGSEVIVLNALRKKKHYSHFNLEQSVRILEELRPSRGYLTHISHQMGRYIEVMKELPGFIQLAYDGLQVEF
ncbi:MAG: MBL fold metallo-hydrolase [Bacteroidetes bacterium]|nr:MBL fold metallo-hydrolase [Bacteroidota bacterium]